jgi:hypothetical protein
MIKEFVVMRTVKIVLWMLLLALVMVLGACRSQSPTEEVPVRQLLLNFFAIVKAAPEEMVQMEIGVSGVTELPDDPAFAGLWELRDAAGNRRAAGEIAELPRLAGEQVLVTWQGQLDPGRYELTWGAPEYGGLVKVFEIVEVDGHLQLGNHQDEYITTAYPPVMP